LIKYINSQEKNTEVSQSEDSAGISLLIQTARASLNNQPVKTIELTEEAIALAEKLNEKSLLSEALLLQSSALTSTGRLNEAIPVTEKVLEVSGLTGDRTVTARGLHNMGDIFRLKGDYPRSIELLNESKKVFEELNDADGYAKNENILGAVYLMTTDFEQALLHYTNAIKIFEELGNEKRTAGILSNIGGVYYFTGDYPKALEYFQQALTINEKHGSMQWKLSNLGNIGSLYFELSDYERALDHFQKALDLSNEIHYKYGAIQSLANIGNVYSKTGDNVKAIEYLNDSLRLSEESGDEHSQSIAHMNIGTIEIKMLLFKDSFNNLTQSMTLAEKLDSKELIATLNYNFGLWHFTAPDEIQTELGFDPVSKYENAVRHLMTALKICEETNLQNVLKDCYRLLSDVYEKTGDAVSALDNFKKYIEIRDSVQGEESKKQITRKEMQYDFDKREALAIAEQEKKDELALKELQRQKFIRNSFVTGFGAVLTFAGIFFKQRNKIREGKKLSDRLLLNILPEEVAEELKIKGSAEAKQFDEVTVMFTDFKGFTQISERLTPPQLVAEIDMCFKAFDEIISKYNIEKIKTIGDSYMCAGGLPVVNNTNAADVIMAALDIQQFMLNHLDERKNKGEEIFEIRIGVHTGPVVAGIVGVKKFAYDIWGNTVNIASRMESSGEPGKINISGATYEIIKDKFDCTHRGKIQAKNKGEIDMYFVNDKY